MMNVIRATRKKTERKQQINKKRMRKKIWHFLVVFVCFAWMRTRHTRECRVRVCVCTCVICIHFDDSFLLAFFLKKRQMFSNQCNNESQANKRKDEDDVAEGKKHERTNYVAASTRFSSDVYFLFVFRSSFFSSLICLFMRYFFRSLDFPSPFLYYVRSMRSTNRLLSFRR